MIDVVDVKIEIAWYFRHEDRSMRLLSHHLVWQRIVTSSIMKKQAITL